MITKPHQTYIPPTAGQVKKEMKTYNAKGINPLFIKETCNLFSHHLKDKSIKNGFIKKDLTPKEKKSKEFFQAINFDKISEGSPIKSAMKLGLVLQSMQSGGCSTSEQSDEATIDFFSGIPPKEMKAAVRRAQELVEKIEQLEPGDFMAKKLGITEDPFKDLDAFNLKRENIDILDNVGKFNAMGSLKSKATKTFKPDEFGKLKRILPINNYSEISKITPSSFVKPDFQYKLVTKQLYRAKGIEMEKSKQIIFMIVDDSGSMCSIAKISRVKALLLNRISEVVKGNAELYICTFERHLDNKWIHVNDEKSANTVWDNFRKYFTFSRNTTSVQDAVEEAVKQIKTGVLPAFSGPEINITKGVNPEICVINDGQDSVNSNFKPSLPLHVFIMGQEHQQLKACAINSRGSYNLYKLTE